MIKPSPSWTAPREGHDWIDNDVLVAVHWLKSFVTPKDWAKREAATLEFFLTARGRWAQGETTPLFDLRDKMAWYVFQAETYAKGREYWEPNTTARVVPHLKKIGKELDVLKSVGGVDARVARAMTSGRADPDASIFELLVALAYKRNGWEAVEFVPEQPGIARTHDIDVRRNRSRWAVECKWMRKAAYLENQKPKVHEMARLLQVAALERNVSAIVEVDFRTEIDELPTDYLRTQFMRFRGNTPHVWEDEYTRGMIRLVDWRLARQVFASDYVYAESSRYIELLTGVFDEESEYEVFSKWRPAKDKPFFADQIYQAVVVRWRTSSETAQSWKAKHFKSIVAKANGQFPGDRPAVVHVGVEASLSKADEFWRHFMNTFEMRWFDPKVSRLRWVYGNYLAPEQTTHPNETWAITETTVPYRVGRHSTAEPLPRHMLLDEESKARDGVHWDGLGLRPCDALA